MMRTAFKVRGVAVVLLCLVFSGCQAFNNGSAAADRAIDDFHYKYNNDRFAELAAQRHQKMKDNETDDAYVAFLSGIKAKFGRQQSSAYLSGGSMGIGEKFHVERETTYEKGKAVEKFLFELHGDDAVLLGYTFSSKDLLK